MLPHRERRALESRLARWRKPMSVHEPIHHRPKTLAESAICFGCAIGLLAVASVVVQWAMHLVP